MAKRPAITITKAAIRRRKRIALLRSWYQRILEFLRKLRKPISAPNWGTTQSQLIAVNPPSWVTPNRPTAPMKRIQTVAKIAMVAGSTNCPACTNPLHPSQAMARCVGTPSHAIHAECRAFMKGKCPICQREMR